jgi:ferric-dicitrate binding protein FerR (iron transport regulator)
MDMQPPLWEEVLRAVHNGQQPTNEQWLALQPDERELIEGLQEQQMTGDSVGFLNSMNEDQAWQALRGNIRQLPGRMQRMRFLKYAAVVAGVLLTGAATLFFLRKGNSTQPVVAGKYITQPVNTKRAVLVLADGRHIELNKVTDASIHQGTAEVVNIDTALLRYTAAAGAVQPAPFNTLIVPRGGKYKIELADGTEVWLNAETKLRYPIHFGGVSKRSVFLESGEAYFKVKRNTEQPFIVTAGGMDITVLGTEFNVNTYTKDYATTLAHGSVQLSAGTAVTKLKPGEQGVYAGGTFTSKPVDVDSYTAWIDGRIIFEEAPLEEVMNSLGRQFDFTIRFTSPQLKERKFGGRFRQTKQIEDVLTAIGKAGDIQFSIQGRTIYVSPVTTN